MNTGFSDFWQALSAISTAMSCCISNFILLVTAVILLRQLDEIKKATYANVYKMIGDILQAEDVRDARRFVFVTLENKPFESWTEKERRTAEKVCHTYDLVGQLARNNIFPKKFVVDNWGNSLRKSWRILSPLVLSYRVQGNSMEVWDDFEWLANEAKSFQKALHN